MPWESTVAPSSGYCGIWLVATGKLLTVAVLADNSPNLEGLLFAWVDEDVYWGSRSNSGYLTWWVDLPLEIWDTG